MARAFVFDARLTRPYVRLQSAWCGGGTTLLSDASHVRTEGADEARYRGIRHGSHCCAARRVWAQEVFPDVEYIQGRTGFPEKIKGKLVIQETGLTFFTKHDSTVFTAPLATLKDVTNSLQTDPGSAGRKLILCMFPPKRPQMLHRKPGPSHRAEPI